MTKPIITPTIGRMLFYYPNGRDNSIQKAPNQNTPERPLSAQVAYVWTDHCVNIGLLDANGQHTNRTRVLLVQGDMLPPNYGGAPYCTWMPFQLGQATKTAEPENANAKDQAEVGTSEVASPLTGSP